MTDRNGPSQTHYDLLGIKPTASPQEIRRAYRDLSKRYHPDTTNLPADVAKAKFQVLNEAYAVLSSPEKRLAYDYQIGYSRMAVIQAPAYLNQPNSERSRYEKSNAYLDPTDRPLSAGELFALFILGITFVCCLMLVIAVGWSQGELVRSPFPEIPTTAELRTPDSPESSATTSPSPPAIAPSPPIPSPPDDDSPPPFSREIPQDKATGSKVI
ncbi:MAG: J domain-containing protein [Leptolyngbyaceae cyanobacterium T60_A2020_046]|nr:J domain-containing protein [Leptolyngbyaceae cyanobacterium T60_A2020_046]